VGHCREPRRRAGRVRQCAYARRSPAGGGCVVRLWKAGTARAACTSGGSQRAQTQVNYHGQAARGASAGERWLICRAERAASEAAPHARDAGSLAADAITNRTVRGHAPIAPVGAINADETAPATEAPSIDTAAPLPVDTAARIFNGDGATAATSRVDAAIGEQAAASLGSECRAYVGGASRSRDVRRAYVGGASGSRDVRKAHRGGSCGSHVDVAASRGAVVAITSRGGSAPVAIDTTS